MNSALSGRAPLTCVRPNDAAEMLTRARAPLRLGLAGGGTDLSPYCDDHNGAVLNCTIDRFAYAFVEPRRDGRVEFRARDLGIGEELDPGDVGRSELALHRGVYQRLAREFPDRFPLAATITTTVDVPAGSGLGSSSALVVAMINALRVHLDLPLGPYEVARLAVEIERIDLDLSGGKQDQYSAEFGGLNFIEFLAEGRVVVNPMRLPRRIANEFEASLVACFSGRSRDSSAIIDQQRARILGNSAPTLEALHRLKSDAIDMKRALLLGRVGEVAEILDRSWASKKATAAAVSNPRLDQIYDLAKANGAWAGKVSGAGGGGFMMFIVPPEDRLPLIESLTAFGAAASPVKFVETGCEVWQVAR